ncbi:helix-turn-helix transcriptional regulator [Herbiconiux liukaitaii]|uniref:helix-turn-helix transcriptional regulator n=1 Tax=Herbiconiux liukaitaii TaxID=3342799 RepID=UPI0035B8CBEE
MRADRLIATVLLLQARDRITARELADELEISVATARRDLLALSSAGIPVYPQAGRGGGWALLGGARTDLSGLSSPEAQALFVLLGPHTAGDPAARSALRKLLRALPATFRDDAEAAAATVVADPAPWGGSARPRPAFVEELQTAVIRRRLVRIRYAGWSSPEADYLVAPWGLVEKNEVWYLLAGVEPGEGDSPGAGVGVGRADGALAERTFRVDRMRAVTLTEEPADRPADFDLAAAWDRVVAGVERERASTSAVVIVPSSLLGYLRSEFGQQHVEELAAHDDGRTRIRISAPTETLIARRLAGWGAFAEVLEPPAVRLELAAIAEQLRALYAAS